MSFFCMPRVNADNSVDHLETAVMCSYVNVSLCATRKVECAYCHSIFAQVVTSTIRTEGGALCYDLLMS